MKFKRVAQTLFVVLGLVSAKLAKAEYGFSPASTCGFLQLGDRLNYGGSVASPNGNYQLKLGSDGLVVSGNHTETIVWPKPSKDSSQNFFLTMQSDGNAAIYKTTSTIPVWTTGLASSPPTSLYNYLAMQNDGNLVIYTYGGTANVALSTSISGLSSFTSSATGLPVWSLFSNGALPPPLSVTNVALNSDKSLTVKIQSWLQRDDVGPNDLPFCSVSGTLVNHPIDLNQTSISLGSFSASTLSTFTSHNFTINLTSSSYDVQVKFHLNCPTKQKSADLSLLISNTPKVFVALGDSISTAFDLVNLTPIRTDGNPLLGINSGGIPAALGLSATFTYGQFLQGVFNLSGVVPPVYGINPAFTLYLPELANNLDFSWSTGKNISGIYHAEENRFPSSVYNFAQPGVTSDALNQTSSFSNLVVSELFGGAQPAQVDQLISHVGNVAQNVPVYVTLFIGANDVCNPPFSRTNFSTNVKNAIDSIEKTFPAGNVTIYLAPIPNILSLRQFRNSSIPDSNITCGEIWNTIQSIAGVGLCDGALSVEADINSFEQQRKLANSDLESLAKTAGSKIVFAKSLANKSFTFDEISQVDCFHPSARGQQDISDVVFAVPTNNGQSQAQ